VNRPLQRIFQIACITTKWRVDWPGSLRSGRSIVEDLGVDTEDPLHFAIEASQIGSQSMKDNFKPQDVVSYENHTTTSCGF
jgi:hypothetical protein